MKEFLIVYLLFGLNSYYAIAVLRLDSFDDATRLQITRGFLLMLLIWPIAPIAIRIYDLQRKR